MFILLFIKLYGIQKKMKRSPGKENRVQIEFRRESREAGKNGRGIHPRRVDSAV